MQMNGLAGGFYKISEWIMKLAYINLLWIVFTLVGLIVFGFFPATTAMLAVIRKLIMGETDIPVFKTFLTSYKKEFKKSNVIGIIMFVIGYILYFDLSIVREANGLIRLIYFPLLMIFLGYVLTSFYFFPVIVHYETKIFQAIKNSFIIMILHPLPTIMMVIGTVAIYFLMITIPGLIPIFCGSLSAFVIMWSALLAFSKIEKKQEEFALQK
ncbi:YesL family protein [Metabacillus bambusae]|uniref:YesL family protein n=1 Tax=Metabacillus bambusae TaxID=2795218 RepID=A0ABS3N1F4_9BACI|nr:YesL family protein [Metabacillus bambusae]MBO1512121.1 YesL family protein [Metabacillus bambusae]